MPDFDGGFKIAAHNSGREMCRLAGVDRDACEPLGATLQTTERLADRAFLARRGNERFVVYFEAYSVWKSVARWSILSKSALLSERERLPTLTLVFILTPERYREQQGTFRLEVGAEPTQQVWFREICLWQERPEPWWEKAPGLMAMLPLCDHGLEVKDAVAYAAWTITGEVSDTVVRANLLTTLAFFGKLASPGFKVLELIGREHMRESKFFEEVMAEGRIEGKRTSVLEALELRFGPDAVEEFAEALSRVKDIDQLSDLHRSRGLGAIRRKFASRLGGSSLPS